MKINIIHHDKSHNMMTDAETLSYIFKRLKEKPTVSHVHINTTKIEEATVNIFLENINMFHLGKAKYNIFIPNQQYFHKNWIEQCDCFDMVVCKTKYCYDIFNEYLNEDKLVFTGWRSPDMVVPSIEKERDEWLVVYNDPYMNDLQKLLDLWTLERPTLNIMFTGSQSQKLKRVNLPNINYIENISPEKFSQLFNRCLIHLCLDETDCFSHNVNQCHLVKSVPVVTSRGPVSEVADYDASFQVSSSRKRYRGGMGSVYKYSKEDLEETIKKILGTSDTTLEIMGRNGRLHSEKKQHIFVDRFTSLLRGVFEKTKHIKFNRKEYKEEDLPTLSVVTSVNNLKDIFRICVLNYTSSQYPKDKLEWVIVDDSDIGEDVEHLLPSKENRERFNINYIHLEEKTHNGEKLNIGVENSSHDCILIMNQDDFFYEKGYSNIARELLKSEKRCVGMTQYGCFDINNYISIVNTSSPILCFSDKLYSGGMCFYKKHWEEAKFGVEGNELGVFMRNRLVHFCEISYTDNMVGLIHTRNKHIRVSDTKEPNGCHFSFSEKLFKYVCSLDEQAKKEKEDREKEMEEIRREAEKDAPETIKQNENSNEIKEI
tara:strand:+ start:2034 stop:3830 length:1797 start_codon:yes stop_codon:yes gene_type:complete